MFVLCYTYSMCGRHLLPTLIIQPGACLFALRCCAALDSCPLVPPAPQPASILKRAPCVVPKRLTWAPAEYLTRSDPRVAYQSLLALTSSQVIADLRADAAGPAACVQIVCSSISAPSPPPSLARQTLRM